MSLVERYKQDGIWTMASPRESCVVPERPLIIDEREEVALNQLALAAWRAMGNVLDAAEINPAAYRGIIDGAKPFPDGALLPPAIRIDTVRTAEGPKIVEIDPVTAISLGETAALAKLWSELGYAVPNGLVDTIAAALPAEHTRLSITLPRDKRDYANEIEFLKAELLARDVELADDGVPLSAFNDTPVVRRRINREGWISPHNPLWGSLIGLADKTNLDTLLSGDKIRLPMFLPRTYRREELEGLEPDMLLVVKPRQGMGSVGVKLATVKEGLDMPDGRIYQDVLEPLSDNFGIEGEWVSRVSVYAGRYGLLGAQVTARRREPDFTNVHGQADAIQTTVAINT